MRLYLCLLFLALAGAGVFAQLSPMELVPNSVDPPPPDNELLSQAKQSLAEGNYTMAESQFLSLSRLTPFSLEAREGLLDAFLAQGKYGKVLQETRAIDKLRLNFNTNNYRAWALLNLGRLPEARSFYHKALDPTIKGLAFPSVSWQGLAYTYKALGDYPAYRKYQLMAGGANKLDDLSFSTSLAYKVPGKDKQTFSFKQSSAYRSWSLSAAYENFLLERKAYRQVYSMELGKQLQPIDLQLQARALEGEDERVYPARQIGTKLSPKVYLNSLVLRPELSLSYSHYPRFDAQQLSFSPLVLLRDYDLGYSLQAVWLDHEAVDADSLHISYQLSLGKKLPWGMHGSLQAGLGNDTWALDASGNVIDTFNQAGDYYGASLSKLIGKQVLLTAYWQKWKSDQLLFFSVKGFY